jgi:hypothetical protein
VKIDNGEWKLVEPTWGAGGLGCQLKNEGYVLVMPEVLCDGSWSPSTFQKCREVLRAVVWHLEYRI